MSIQEAYLEKILRREQDLKLRVEKLETDAGRIAKEAGANWRQLREARKEQRRLQREIASLDRPQPGFISGFRGDIEDVRTAFDYSTSYFRAYFK